METPLLTTKVKGLRWNFRIFSLFYLATAALGVVAPKVLSQLLGLKISSSTWPTLSAPIVNLIYFFALSFALLGVALFYLAQSGNDPGIKRTALLMFVLNFLIALALVHGATIPATSHHIFLVFISAFYFISALHILWEELKVKLVGKIKK
jgi:hypothetical protein